MVGHQHSIVPDLLVGADHLDEIDVPAIRECLLKVQKATLDVAKVDVEDLLLATQIADHLVDLLVGILEHFGYRSLAEIEAVVRAGVHVDKAFQSVKTAQHAMDTAEAFHFRHPWIVGVAGHLHLLLGRHRHHALQEVIDALPRLAPR